MNSLGYFRLAFGRQQYGEGKASGLTAGTYVSVEAARLAFPIPPHSLTDPYTHKRMDLPPEILSTVKESTGCQIIGFTLATT